MRIRIKFTGFNIFLVFLIIFSLLIINCAVNPVTGKKELSLISVSQEKALGKQTDGEIRSQYGVVEEEKIVSYVRSIGQAIVPYTHRPELEYHFAVLDSPVVNAFAVPGGYIYVTRGILALMSSEAELAVVLGHELGHVAARHSLRRLSKMILVQTGLAVIGSINETLADIAGLASVGLQLLFLKYSRDDEYQADSLGVEYARKAGWTPGHMVDFFASLDKLGDLSGGKPLPGFLSTHPLTKDRIARVKSMLTEEDQKLKVNRELYLERLQGLIYGDDPRQGFVEKGKFYHPELKFVFAFPTDWQVQNTPSQVQLSSKDEQAALVLMAEKSGETLETYAHQKMAKIQGASFMRADPVETNFPSYHACYLVSQPEKETLYLRLGLVRKDEYIYSFYGLASFRHYLTYDEEFKKALRSFSTLTDSFFLNRRPKRIYLMRASGKESLAQIFERAGMPKDLWPPFAIMNHLSLDSVPPANSLIKTVRTN